jgi:hypothetical protein
MFPDTIFSDEIVANYKNHSWRDLDHYYRHTLPAYHNNQDYTENLKKHVIFQLSNPVWNFFANADAATLGFYVHEMEAFSFQDAATLKYLQALEGKWPAENIRQTALACHNKTQQYLREHMKDPEAALAQVEAPLNALKNYAAGNK